MSEDDLEAVAAAAEAAAEMCCASCGIAEVDDIKLSKCTNCDLVEYCSDKCQQDHRPIHEQACKERVAELRDEILFRQPECAHLGDCPICFLPLSIDEDFMLQSCCSKKICKGCVYANSIREREERLQHKCPFCRHPLPETEEEADRNTMKRAAANDPVAINKMGEKLYHKGEYERSFEYWTKAAELGDMHAHYLLFTLYGEGEGVEKDEKKELYHLEKAAIAGHPKARYNLGIGEVINGKFDRAVKHFIIAAKLGHYDSIQRLKECYVHGKVSKEDFAAALRAHQAAVDVMKSTQREEAAKAEATGEIVWSKR